MKKLKLLVLALLVIGFLLSCASATGGSKPKITVLTSGKVGTDGGYFYSFWTTGVGDVTVTLDGGDGYSVEWTKCGNFTCGKGWLTGSGHTIAYAGDFQATGGGAFGIYGWTTEPLVEYYICETWPEGNNPAAGGTLMGTLTSDGDTYDVYTSKRVNQPSIRGTATFVQFKSYRRTQRTSGTITVQNHFDAWDKMGLKLGKYQYYQILLTEGWNGSGSAHATVREVSK